MYNQEEESGITIPQFFRTDLCNKNGSTSKRAKKQNHRSKNSRSETNFYNKYNDTTINTTINTMIAMRSSMMQAS